jgi:DNA-binding response OmpR family regulator
MENKQLLLAEYDQNQGFSLQQHLQNKGWETTLARNGKDAHLKYQTNKNGYDFIILDVCLPEMDGFSLVKKIRETDQKTPILILSAKGLKEDKLEGFSLGADDYVTKPFSIEELLARMEAIFRRSDQQKRNNKPAIKLGQLLYQPELRLLHLASEIKKLTTKENQLLHLLFIHKNGVLNRQETLRTIWGDDNYYNGRSMDVYISKLRKLLMEDPALEIMNVHGLGFKLLIK